MGPLADIPVQKWNVSEAHIPEDVQRVVKIMWDGDKGVLQRVLKVDTWINGDAEPEQPLDHEAICYYGLCYLGASHYWRSPPDGTVAQCQVGYKRLFLRQCIDYHRFHPHTPLWARDLIDDTLKILELPIKYRPREHGREVVAVQTGQGPTLFSPLLNNVEEAIAMLGPAELPDDGWTDEQDKRWRGMAGCFIGVLGSNLLSPKYGLLIERILACYLSISDAYPERFGALRRDIERYTKAVRPMVDLGAGIAELEKDIGLVSRAAKSDMPKKSNWRKRRAERRRRGRRR